MSAVKDDETGVLRNDSDYSVHPNVHVSISPKT